MAYLTRQEVPEDNSVSNGNIAIAAPHAQNQQPTQGMGGGFYEHPLDLIGLVPVKDSFGQPARALIDGAQVLMRGAALGSISKMSLYQRSAISYCSFMK